MGTISRGGQSVSSHSSAQDSRMELEIVHAKTSKPVVTLTAQPATSTVGDLKRAIASAKPKYKDVNRQELRQEPRGKFLKDEATLESLGINENTTLYFKDRGTQIGWTTVFLAEYMGPLIVYLLFYIRPWIVYGDTSAEMSTTAHLAAAVWTFHYAKRVLEHSSAPPENTVLYKTFKEAENIDSAEKERLLKE